MPGYLEAFVEDEWAAPAHVSYRDVLRSVLTEDLAALPDPDLDLAVEQYLNGLSPAEVEGFWSSVKKVASAGAKLVQKAAPTVLPVAGAAVGTLLGGPVGTAVGAQLGSTLGKGLGGRPPNIGTMLSQAAPSFLPGASAALGSLVGGASGSAVASQLAGALGGVVGGRAPRPAPAVTQRRGRPSAASQLMWLMDNPTLLRALLGSAMGTSGRKSVSVGSRSVPVSLGALMNALSYLATRTGEEYAESLPDAEEAHTETYLLDASGNFACDPAVSEARAERLIEVLRAAEQEADVVTASPSEFDSVTEWFVAADLVR